jgi:hypothetical protein
MPMAGPTLRSVAVVVEKTVEAPSPSTSRSVSRLGCDVIYVTYVGTFFYVGLHMKLCTSDISIPPTSFPVDSFDFRCALAIQLAYIGN